MLSVARELEERGVSSGRRSRQCSGAGSTMLGRAGLTAGSGSVFPQLFEHEAAAAGRQRHQSQHEDSCNEQPTSQ